ncbi:MAG: threonine synthase [Thermotogota bacterium]|nr:threonine synthase [Thermotogota bacterium]
MSEYRLRCISCGREFSKEEVEYTCPVCGDRKGTLEVLYDYEFLSKRIDKSIFRKYSNEGIWQFKDILPVSKDTTFPALEVGNTPTYFDKDIAKQFNLNSFSVKDDGRNPSASYKDRASAVAVVKAKEKNYDTIFCASTGNAASSLACFSAVSNLKCIIFVPATSPEAKLAQMQVYGANVIAIDGSYDIAFDISMKVGLTNGWYCRNSAINPYLLEGKKTGALELAVQYSWKLPDYVFVSVGDGTVYSSFCKGFYDLKQLGLIEKSPIVIGVQAEKISPITDTFQKGEPFEPIDVEGNTVADSIGVGKPRDVIKAIKYAKRFNGNFVKVTDEEILDAVAQLARKTGVFAEPAGAASFAGFKKYAGLNSLEGKNVSIIVTGNGLKDLKSAMKKVGSVKIYPADEKVIREAFR